MEELSSDHHQEGDINPLPINSYGGGGGDGNGHDHDHDHDHGHLMHHNHHHCPSSGLTPQAPLTLQQDHHHVLPYINKKKNKDVVIIRYMECLKNHAAPMGGSATDGCGEFMPSGEQGTLEALHCSACNCHRNFHRKQIEGDDEQPISYGFFNHPPPPPPLFSSSSGSELRKLILGHHHHHHHPKNVFVGGSDPTTHYSLRYPTPPNVTPRATTAKASASAHHNTMMSYNNYIAESDHEQHQDIDIDGVMMMPHHHLNDHLIVKKRFRTKFTQEQKEKMLSYAEGIGWKLNKQEDDVVQQFCQEIGVKRRVLKVWMHNNKHNLAKKNNPSSSSTT